MLVGTLSFRFGWRWLLPVQIGSICRLYGFSAEEEQFWMRALPDLIWSSSGAGAEVLLVEADHCVRGSTPSNEEIKSARVVCVVASRLYARRWHAVLKDSFERIQEYGLLPSSRPRVVVPLASSQQAVTALGLHRPGRWTARLVLRIARALAGVGSLAMLRGRVLIIATQGPDLVPRGATQANLMSRRDANAMDFALYLGTADDNRKTIVLPMGTSAPHTILKVAETQQARCALQSEAAALAALASSHIKRYVPKLQGLVVGKDALTLFQEYRQRRQVDQSQMDTAVISFLGQLSLLNRQTMPVSTLLDAVPSDAVVRLPDEVEPAWRALRANLQLLAESGAELWVHRTHGDFAPWNCAWTDQGLFVYDWEESGDAGLALGDAFYYAISLPLLLQRKVVAAKTLQAALRLADKVAEASGMALDSRPYLALWLLGRVGKADLYDELIVLLERCWR